jgi:hypothetical protein
MTTVLAFTDVTRTEQLSEGVWFAWLDGLGVDAVGESKDAACLALGRKVASTLDAMPDGERSAWVAANTVEMNRSEVC